MSRLIKLVLSFAISSLASGIWHPASAQHLPFPWAGGMNACQFCPIDIDLDGQDDLLVFDRHGNRIMTWIRNGTGFALDNSYAPLFPDLHDWVMSADYNCDGKQDLFTYSLGGARVFRNDSDTSLKFTLVTNLLKSYYYSGYVGILLTSVDYPAIADIDGDGDLDLLTFFGLGSYVEYHQNQAMEKFGNCDSLDYKLTEHCWGNFKESEESNQLSLNIICPYKYSNTLACSNRMQDDPPKHTGSTLLATDLNGDQVMDLLLGDVDFPLLIALTNGGTKDSAHIISQDTLFPTGTRPVKLFSFPAGQRPDANNDGIRDLVIAPFDPGYANAENKRSSWLYVNQGSNEAPVFQFSTDSWLQDQMLDFGTASYPAVADLNLDGRPDLIVGNFGYYDSSYYENLLLKSAYTSKIAYLRNTGSGFTMAALDLAGASATACKDLYPAIGDLDGDGAPDIVAGQSDGTLIWFRNKNEGSDPPVFDPPLYKYQNIDVGNNSTPQLFDLDRDGLQDLIIGEQNGNLNYYRNTGSGFQYITDSLGKVNVTNPALSYYGYSTPCFFRDVSDVTGLLAGSEEGTIHYYKNIDDNLSGTFTRCDTLSQVTGGMPFSSEPCWRSSPATGFITSTEYNDIIAGNFSGGLNFYSPRTLPQVIIGMAEQSQFANDLDVNLYPNPAGPFVTISIDGPAVGRGNFYVFDAKGIQVFEGTFDGDHTIQTKTFTPGLYLVRVITTTGISGTGRLLILH